MPRGPKFDRIGYWSELKLDIIREYAAAYSTILTARRNPSFYHIYVEGFAGMGVHLSKAREGFVPGSPLNALKVQPPFHQYHLIDIQAEKIEYLSKLIGRRNDVFLYRGDCNKILLEKVFPQVKYENYRRGMCILDPYGLDLDWKVMRASGQMRTLDVFLNFPVMDINRNVLWRNPDKVGPSQVVRMNTFWGDESWRTIAYRTDESLFNWPEKQSNDVIADAFRARLQKIAGFARVPQPLPMRNSTGAIVYYLFFASQNNTAEGIVMDIFRKYENRGER